MTKLTTIIAALVSVMPFSSQLVDGNITPEASNISARVQNLRTSANEKGASNNEVANTEEYNYSVNDWTDFSNWNNFSNWSNGGFTNN